MSVRTPRRVLPDVDAWRAAVPVTPQPLTRTTVLTGDHALTSTPNLPRVPGTETLSSFERRTLRSQSCSLHLIPDQQPSISDVQEQDEAHERIHCGNAQRERWLAALSTAWHCTKLRIRLESCGKNAWVERCSRTGKTRLVAPACKLRFCPRCATIHARRTKARLSCWAESVNTDRTNRLRMVTLTQRSSPAPLKDQLHHLYAAYRRLRQRAVWKKATVGAIAVLQVTFNPQTQQWHPHLHVVHHGRYIDYRVLRQAWKRVTHGSEIVDIREIHDASRAADYVARYVSRPLDDDPTIPPPRLLEFVAAIKGKRMLIASGKAPLILPELEPDEHDWQHVDSLAGLMHRARGGDAEALAILNSLPHAEADVPDAELSLFDLAEPDDDADLDSLHDPTSPGT